jgi:hypothetical protein
MLSIICPAPSGPGPRTNRRPSGRRGRRTAARPRPVR